MNVPEGIRRERLLELQKARRWPELRASVIDNDGLPEAWDQAVGWYRRASRVRSPGEAEGVSVAIILCELWAVGSCEVLG